MQSEGAEGSNSKSAVIIGGGPAGLTAAYELLARAGIRPVVLEMSTRLGGISRTVNYKGNRIDIGGHRFFSKSDRVMDWWRTLLPVDDRHIDEGEPAREALLVRQRLSRILFLRQFFEYPLHLSLETIMRLGPARTLRIALGYARAMVFPIRPEINLEHFFINRFGRPLYDMFFKEYTEKVWGVACPEISASWGAQRVKGLSIVAALRHLIKQAVRRSSDNLSQKETETSLIERFLYPSHGPGQMWEAVGRRVVDMGGEIHHNIRINKLTLSGGRVDSVEGVHVETGDRRVFSGDYVVSSMPVPELIEALAPPAPPAVGTVAKGLRFRDFVTVGLLCRRMRLKDPATGGRPRDNWIYLQEPGILAGRLQIFNNWSPFMVADPNTTWLGVEYFCQENDALWSRTDAELIELAKREMAAIDVAVEEDVIDGVVIRMPKAYPAYFGSYDQFSTIREWVDTIPNLFLIGRNGMHRYNNQDHSMLAAMMAVDQIASGRVDREALWSLNTEQEYHEQKPAERAPACP